MKAALLSIYCPSPLDLHPHLSMLEKLRCRFGATRPYQSKRPLQGKHGWL
jgi:hypothetical protein